MVIIMPTLIIMTHPLYHLSLFITSYPSLLTVFPVFIPLHREVISGSIKMMSYVSRNAIFSAIRTLFIIPVLLLCTTPSMADSFSILQERETPLSVSALDIAVSSDGQYTFVLTKAGEVAIYSVTGDLVQTLKVGKGFDTIEYSPAGNRLILGGTQRQQLKVLSLAFIYELDYARSPFKGPAGAPVTIAVFNDFQ